jgi:hypothetical protein
MSITKVQIISNALAQLGHAPIVSLIGGDKMVVAAEQAYDLKLPSVLSTGNWRFAVQIQELSALIEPPPLPWKTAYLLPAGYLKTIRLYPNIYVFDLYTDNKLYTYYQGPLLMEYVFSQMYLSCLQYL